MNAPLSALDFYLLRLPVLPLSELRRLHAAPRREDLVAALHVLYQQPALQEAIYLASPELHQEMGKWLGRPAVATTPAEERLVLTLYKYLLRMSSRCTPYGLFAGFSTGRIGAEASRWQLAPAGTPHGKHARLDMNYVAELSKQLEADPALRERLTFFVNTSLYRTHDTYRYYEYRVRNKRRHYYLVSIKASVYIERVLAAAAGGATLGTLRALLEAEGVGAAAAANFLHRLTAAQVLLSELEPTVTGPEFYHCLLARVEALAPEHASLAPLRRISELLRQPGAGIDAFREVQAVIQASFPAATSKDLIQTDLRLSLAHNALSTGAVAQLTQELGALSGLFKSAVPKDLQSFATSFYERYEEQEIPLLEALDSEAGLGYGTASGARISHAPLVDDVRLPRKPAAPSVAWSAYRQLVFRKFHESQAGQPVRLTDADLAALAGEQPPQLPATLYALGSWVAASPAALDRGDFKFHLYTCTGPGAMPLLARFAHADAGLAAQLVELGAREQQAHGEALVAEVVHLPEARVGNVLQRPQLRAYEIPFLGQASVPAEQQIPVADLLVSVRQGKVVLRSKRLGREVLPRLTTAHNYARGLAVYKFLCDLQHQHESFGIVWDWGVLLNQSFLPRVEYKRVILSRARWTLPAEAHAAVAALATPEQVQAFRAQYGLPRQVLLVNGDNELLLDLDCPLAVELLAQRLKKGAATVVEFVHEAPSELLVDEQGRSYVNEVILPLAATTPRPAAAPAAPRRRAGLPTRAFALGSEWTYLKVYCGAKWADRVLTEHLLPCIQDLEARQLVSQWFFIRFTDPKPHLRLRFRHDGQPATVAALLGRLHQALAGLLQERVVHSVQYDTYQREIERYGAETMGFSEAVFHHDSRAVLGFLNLIEGDEGERYRWLFALRGADQLLADFGLTLSEKAAVAELARQSFFQEFKGNADLTHQLNDKYRAVSRQLAGFLDPANDAEEIQDAVELFAVRSRALRAELAALPAAVGEALPGARLTHRLRQLLPSYLHMFLNRMFVASQRLHELVVYHYLVKHYAAQAARAKKPAAVEA